MFLIIISIRHKKRKTFNKKNKKKGKEKDAP